MTATPDILNHAEVPFDAARPDRLMEEAGIDVLLATSKHNTCYLLGGYGFIFFSAMDAIGHSRYLPIVIYRKGRPDHAAYVANGMERAEHANRPFWTPAFHPSAWGTLDAAADAVEHLKTIGRRGRASVSSRPSCPRTRGRCSGSGCRGRGSWMRPGCWSGCGRSRRRANWRNYGGPRS